MFAIFIHHIHRRKKKWQKLYNVIKGPINYLFEKDGYRVFLLFIYNVVLL